MKANDFDFAKDLRFNLKEGLTTFRDTRLVIFNVDAIGLLRESVIRKIGMEDARALFLRFGFRNGYSDFLQMKLGYEFDTEIDLFASGPVIHTWEGIVHAAPTEIKFDREAKTFLCSGIWTNSYEAEQHLSFRDFEKDPVCWTLTGYASGWSTAFFEHPLLAIEPFCVGKGDDHCEWLIKPLSEWGEEARPYIEALKDLMGA